MVGPRYIGGYVEIGFIDPQQVIGESILAFCCERCDYTELYREEREARRKRDEQEVRENALRDEARWTGEYSHG